MALSKTVLLTSTCQRLKTCYFTHNTLFSELQPLQSGWHPQASSCKSNRARNSFIPSAITLYNTQQHKEGGWVCVSFTKKLTALLQSVLHSGKYGILYISGQHCVFSHIESMYSRSTVGRCCVVVLYILWRMCAMCDMSWIAFFFLVCMFL